jgi:acetylornithine deacetylase/succinyl-diaminopimelate desuccinylase-like protein
VAHPDFDAAARHVTREAVRAALVDMVDIRSPTGGEIEMARYITARLSACGIASHLQEVDDGRPNAVGHIPGTGEGLNLLFTGHMDTSYGGDEDHLVGDGFKAKAVERDGWIWGLGSMNMKSGLAAALIAMEAVARAGIRLAGDLSYGGVVGEIEKAPVEEFRGLEFSGYGAGSRYLVTHGGTADFAILAEPTGLRICTANMGVLWVRITVPGTVAHSAFARRPGHVNAIDLMAELQAVLREWITLYEQETEYMGENANATVAAIRGGDPWRLARNPHGCSLYLDIRTVPGQSAEAIKRSLRRLLAGFAARTGTPEPELYVYITDPAMEISEDLAVVDALGAAQSEIMGERPASIVRRPGADGVHFTAYGVPCAVFGPAGRLHPDHAGKAMHAIGEHVAIDDVLTASRIYLAAALDLCNRPAPDAADAGRA